VITADALPAPVRAQSNRVLVVALIATTAMLFTAFAAAYMERAGARGWERLRLPDILWVNTLVLALSSVAAEVARRSRARPFDAVRDRSNVASFEGRAAGSARWALPAALLLGVLFLAGQAAAWGELRAQGVFLPTSPYASFFYLLTAVHAVHVAAALVALSVALTRARILGLAVGFWHFMGVVWVYVLLILKVLG
jgi:cytochrome c oxidase subunit 3